MGHPKIVGELKQQLLEMYLTGLYQPKEVAEKFGLCRDSVYNFLKRNGIKHIHKRLHRPRLYSLDETYFDNIDTEEKAYFLGWLASDGWVSKDKSDIELTVQIEDIDILNKFSDELKTNRPVHIIRKNLKNPKLKDCARLSIASRHLAEKIVQLGIKNKKSLILEFPTKSQIPNFLLRHYVRGYFDGDGHIGGRRGANRCQVIASISLTQMFGNTLSEIIYNNFEIQSTVKPVKNKNCWSFEINKTIHAIRFLNWIYEDSKINLSRKFKIYSEMLFKILGCELINNEDLIIKNITTDSYQC